MEKKKVIFLYTELAGYFLACCNKLLDSGFEVHIIRWPVNSEAPFIFRFDSRLNLYDRSSFNRTSLLHWIEKENPDLLFCLGWIDKDYLYASKKSNIKGKKVVVLDNHWKGNFKQRAGVFYSRLNIVPFFDYVWVPGKRQKHFAEKMGFKKEKIAEGYYCADTDLFSDIGFKRLSDANYKIPKKFVYIGRYYEFKGIQDLVSAFSLISDVERKGWELHCFGTGHYNPPIVPNVFHHGFIQPDSFAKILFQYGAFVIPSHIEPWGVVVHEMAMAGFPIIASDAVASADLFLKSQENGFLFKYGHVLELKKALLKIINLTETELMNFAISSMEKGKCITTESWVNQLKLFC
jgi:glycosyltransferase involved in cell wall biosynthesis